VEILVLSGNFSDQWGLHAPYTWLRLPAGARHELRSQAGCELFIKAGGLGSLRSVEPASAEVCG
jgi:hypothetical protein